MRWFFRVLVVALAAVASAAYFYPKLLEKLPAPPANLAPKVDPFVTHVLPDGTEIRVYRFQKRILPYAGGFIDTYDVAVMPAATVADRMRLTDEVFDDLMPAEADLRGLNTATVTFRPRKDDADQSELTALYIRDSDFLWRRDGALAPADNTRVFNIRSPKTFTLSNGDRLTVEGERARNHVLAAGKLMYEASLYWPAENWGAVPGGERRQKAHVLARQYWIERGQAVAEAHGAHMGLIRLYKAPFTLRAQARHNVWIGVKRQSWGWEDIPFSAEEAQKRQWELTGPIAGNWLKLPDGEAVEIELIGETFLTKGPRRKGLVLVYRAEGPLQDKKKVEVHAQQIFDRALRDTCAKARVRSCLVQARFRKSLLLFSWDDTRDVIFELVDGDWQVASAE